MQLFDKTSKVNGVYYHLETKYWHLKLFLYNGRYIYLLHTQVLFTNIILHILLWQFLKSNIIIQILHPWSTTTAPRSHSLQVPRCYKHAFERGTVSTKPWQPGSRAQWSNGPYGERLSLRHTGTIFIKRSVV